MAIDLLQFDPDGQTLNMVIDVNGKIPDLGDPVPSDDEPDYGDYEEDQGEHQPIEIDDDDGETWAVIDPTSSQRALEPLEQLLAEGEHCDDRDTFIQQNLPFRKSSNRKSKKIGNIDRALDGEGLLRLQRLRGDRTIHTHGNLQSARPGSSRSLQARWASRSLLFSLACELEFLRTLTKVGMVEHQTVAASW